LQCDTIEENKMNEKEGGYIYEKDEEEIVIYDNGRNPDT
jgi:hypothetical protein